MTCSWSPAHGLILDIGRTNREGGEEIRPATRLLGSDQWRSSQAPAGRDPPLLAPSRTARPPSLSAMTLDTPARVAHLKRKPPGHRGGDDATTARGGEAAGPGGRGTRERGASCRRTARGGSTRGGVPGKLLAIFCDGSKSTVDFYEGGGACVASRGVAGRLGRLGLGRLDRHKATSSAAAAAPVPPKK